MSSLKHKFLIAFEMFRTIVNRKRKERTRKKQSKGFKAFGKNTIFEEPLYVRKLNYVSIGNDTIIKKNSRIQCDDSYCGVKLAPDLKIGDRCGIGYRFTVFVYDRIEIGDDVSIADNVMITSENHGVDPESELPFGRQPLSVAPVVIGNGVWLSQNVSIMPGVSIGEKSIIGANSVVTHDIPPYSIAVGCPARVVKKWDFSHHCWEKSEDI